MNVDEMSETRPNFNVVLFLLRSLRQTDFERGEKVPWMEKNHKIHNNTMEYIKRTSID